MTNPFDVLRAHARERPDEVAVSTPYRNATYRKMWSRIERSTARLQAEWAVRPGDTIVYLGSGHLDALVMYFAAARCGARVLPLEHPELQQAAPVILREAGAALVLHDDTMPVSQQTLGAPCRPLSSLIATACRHRESILEDTAAISLLESAGSDGGQGTRQRSLDVLCAVALACPAGHHVVAGPLFDPAVFGPVVLAAMLSGERLVLTAGAADKT